MPTKKRKPVKKTGKPTKKKVAKKTTKKTKRKPPTFIEAHKAHCLICRHDLRELIDERYLDGESPQDLAEDPKIAKAGFDRDNVYRHVKAFGLDKKRDNSTLKLVTRIIARSKINTREVSDQLLSKCLDLQSKLKGEVVERLKHEGEIGLKLKTDEVVDLRLKNLNKRLGEDPEEEPSDVDKK